jgi:hypothetical protein
VLSRLYFPLVRPNRPTGTSCPDGNATSAPFAFTGSRPDGHYPPPPHRPTSAGRDQRSMNQTQTQPPVNSSSAHHFPIFHQSYTSAAHYSSPLSPGGKSTSIYAGHTTSTNTVLQSPEAINEALRPQPSDVPSHLNYANNGQAMASTAIFQQPFYSIAAIDGSQQDSLPFGLTRFYPPPTAAVGLGLGESCFLSPTSDK